MQWDAIIVNYNGSLFLDPCLRSLIAMSRAPARIIVVDNKSDDDSLVELAGWPQAEVIASPTNLGYSGGANLGVRTSSAPVVVVMNPDVELDPTFGDALLRVFSENADVGVAGTKLFYPDRKSLQHAGGIVNWPVLTTSHRGHGMPDSDEFSTPIDVDYVTGAAIAIRREAFDDISGFDESLYPAYWEDVEFCRRAAAAGWRVRFEPTLSGIHFEGAGPEPGDAYFNFAMTNRVRFALKHMSPTEWWNEFIPAEISRLRGELEAVESANWPLRSGAEAIEISARSMALQDAPEGSELRGEQLLSSIEAIRGLPELADPRPKDLTPADGVARRIKRLLSRVSGRFYAEELYWHQRQFNESVVRAFEAQDRLNRELVCQLLLSFMLVSQRQARHHSTSDE
jgi:O-antigen biosynthesis protein